MSRVLRAAVLVAAAALLPAAAAATPASPWRTVTIAKSLTGVGAVLSFERRTLPYGAHAFRDMRLVVRHGGKTVYDRELCGLDRCGEASQHGLTLENVWGDSLPEAIVDTFTGGAHCCFESLIVRADGPQADRSVSHDWGDPGYSAETYHGALQLVSADDRFAYAFTDYAASGLPVQVWAIDAHGVLTNVTRSRPDLLRKDERVYWSAYVGQRGKRYGDVRGVLAAWCADEILLGKKPRCDAELTTALAHGWLGGPSIWPTGAKYIAALERSLTKWGYT